MAGLAASHASFTRQDRVNAQYTRFHNPPIKQEGKPADPETKRQVGCFSALWNCLCGDD